MLRITPYLPFVMPSGATRTKFPLVPPIGVWSGATFPALAVVQRGGSHRRPRHHLNPALAQPKISKVAVNYQDHPDGDKRCDKCIQYQPPDACKVVDGSISPQGSCRIFMLGSPRT